MDPITQGALGASAAQILKQNDKIVPISLMAAIAGMSPDLDVLIQSSNDPLLFLVFHRQFTHSLFFIPFGALICSVILHPLIGKRHNFSYAHSLLLCFVAYATHALIDACTSYGTLLLWPFSNERFAWNNIAVVDFFYTVPILLALGLGIKFKSPLPARCIIFWIFFYPYWGYLQKEKAESAAHLYLKNNVHTEKIISLEAKPSITNIVLWKIIYETEGHFYVDALKVGLFEKADDALYFPGDKVEKLNIARDFSWLDPNSQQAEDIQRFSWFSMGFIAKDTKKNNRIMDIRYSMVPNKINPLWSIELDPNANLTQHVKYENHRDTSETTRRDFLNMLFAN